MKPVSFNILETARARRESCPRCGATVLCVEGDDSFSCEHCLFSLGLDDAESNEELPPSTNEERDQPCGTAGPYQLIEEIGRGGMGVIYRAHKPGSPVQFAVKMLLPVIRDRSEALARFIRETQAVAALKHPGIIPIHEVCLKGDAPFFSMDLAVRGSLADLMPKYRGRWHQAARLMVKVARAVHYAHDHGILHRDLKPGNILFTERSEPLVSDFGLAKWLDRTAVDLTQSSVVFGTPNYVAPEQAEGRNRKLTAAADIYSLGAIFFELLAGRPTFVGENPLDVLQQVLRESPPSVRSICPAIPKALEAICHQCLKREPHHRYISAQALADDIEHWLDGKQVTARGPSSLKSLVHYPKIHLLAGAVTVLAFGTLVVMLCAATARKVGQNAPTGDASAEVPTVFTVDLSQGYILAPAEDALCRALATSFGKSTLIDSLFPRAAAGQDGNHALADVASETERKPNSGTVLFESLRIADSKLRIVSQFVERSTGKILWVHVDALPLHPTDGDYQQFARLIQQRIQSQAPSPKTVSAKRQGGNRAEVLRRKAEEFYLHRNKTDNENAIGLYRTSLEIAPGNTKTLAGLAKAYNASFYMWGEDKNRLELARHTALQALSIDPLEGLAHHALADCFYTSSDYRRALDEYTVALETEPQSASAYARVGMCIREMGRPTDALPWMIRATQVDPVHGLFQCILADTYMLTAEDEKADQCLQHCIESDPDQPDEYVPRIILRLWQAKWTEAKRLSEEFVERFPGYRFRQEVAGEVTLFVGDEAKAIEIYQRLATQQMYTYGWEFYGAINPHSALAYLRLRAGETEQAARDLNEAQIIDERLLLERPQNSRLLHDLAAVWLLKGDRTRSLEYLASAISCGWNERRSTLLDPRFTALREDSRFKEMLNTLPFVHARVEQRPLNRVASVR